MLVILTNIPTPYRTAFFDEVQAECFRRGEGFHVIYCAESEPNRFWGYDPAGMRHEHTMLRGLHPRLLGTVMHFNLGVISALRHLRPSTLVVAGAWNTPTMLLAGMNFLSPKPRRLFWSEGHAQAALRHSGIIPWVRRRAYRSYDGFAVPNRRSAEWALAQAGEKREVFSLPNSIDVDFYRRPDSAARSAARRELGLPEQARILVQVATLMPRKGTMELARAFLALNPAERAGAILVYVGTGPLASELAALAARSGGAIRMLGQQPPEGVRKALYAANVFVLNTRRDPNPLSPLEAGAAGLPSLLSSLAGNVDEVILDGQTGFVIPDPEDPSATLRRCLACNDEEIEAMGRRAAERVAAGFSASAVARSFLDQLA